MIVFFYRGYVIYQHWNGGVYSYSIGTEQIIYPTLETAQDEINHRHTIYDRKD